MVNAFQLEQQPRGVLGLLGEPLAARCALIQHLADHFNWSLDEARCALDEDDRIAMQAFEVGNSVPREWLH